MKTKFFLISSLLVFGWTFAMGQYPSMKKEQPIVDSLNREWNKLDNEVWQKAWPAVYNDIKEYKVCNQWAHRPDDLPQADIPAFPGAEGAACTVLVDEGVKFMWLLHWKTVGREPFGKHARQEAPVLLFLM